jgi:hypothetical protein
MITLGQVYYLAREVSVMQRGRVLGQALGDGGHFVLSLELVFSR